MKKDLQRGSYTTPAVRSIELNATQCFAVSSFSGQTGGLDYMGYGNIESPEIDNNVIGFDE